MKTSGVESALEEMSYEVVENSFGMEMPVSKPAGFSCDPEATFDQEALEERLDSKGLGIFSEYVNTDHPEKVDRWHLEFDVLGRGYKRINVKMWPDAVRIYPRENEPGLGELAQITRAIEQAMNCTLHHDPIDE